MNFVDWPDCPVDGCNNKICLSLNSDKCFPHTDGNEHIKRWKIDARNAPQNPSESIAWCAVEAQKLVRPTLK